MSLIDRSFGICDRMTGFVGANITSALGNVVNALSGTLKKVSTAGLVLSSMISQTSTPTFRSFPVSTYVNANSNLAARNQVIVPTQPQCLIDELDFSGRTMTPMIPSQIYARGWFNLMQSLGENSLPAFPLTMYQDLFPDINVSEINSIPPAPIALWQDNFPNLGEYRLISRSDAPAVSYIMTGAATTDDASVDSEKSTLRLLDAMTYDATGKLLNLGYNGLYYGGLGLYNGVYYSGLGVYKMCEVASSLLTPIEYFQRQNIINRYIVKGVFFHHANRLHMYLKPDAINFYDEIRRIRFG